MTDGVAKVSMLVRCSIAAAFDAFVDPQTITRFWLKGTTGPLAPGATLKWTFMVPGATESTTVTEFTDQRRIGFHWSDGVKVAITFEQHGHDAVRVSLEARGFAADKGINAVVDATEGFSIVLCDLKTLLESGKSANLVRDKAALIAASLPDHG